VSAQPHGAPYPKNTFASIKNWQNLVKSLFFTRKQESLKEFETHFWQQ
jgi:hypothetical protein